MDELVTLDQAKAHLKLPLDSTAEDEDLELKLAQAQEMVIDYVKQRVSGAADWAATVDAWTDETAPKVVLAAILRMTAHLYRFRGDDPERDRPTLEPGEWPRDVTTLLVRLRDPALA